MKKFFQNHKALCCVLLFDVLMLCLLVLFEYNTPKCGQSTNIFSQPHCPLNTGYSNTRILFYLISFLTILISLFLAIKKKFRKFGLNLILTVFFNAIVIAVIDFIISYSLQEGNSDIVYNF